MDSRDVILPIFRKFLFSFLWYLRASGKGESLEVTGRSVKEAGSDNCFNIIFRDINEKIGFTEDDVVLDIGCSNGLLFSKIMASVKKGILVDASKTQLELARQTIANERAQFINADAAGIRLPKASVNKAICYSVVHYFKSYEDFESMLRNIYNVLSVGGTALIGDIPFFNMQQGKQTSIYIKLMGLIYVRYSEKQVFDTAGKIGFKARIVPQANNLPYFRTRKDLILEKYC